MQNKFLKPIIYAAILILGIYLGMYISKSNGNFSKIQKGNGSDITLLKDVFSLIDNEYVDTVNLKSLQSKAITHVLESMDPHSEYIEPSILTEVNENLQSSFHGIGVSFRIEKDTITSGIQRVYTELHRQYINRQVYCLYYAKNRIRRISGTE